MLFDNFGTRPIRDRLAPLQFAARNVFETPQES